MQTQFDNDNKDHMAILETLRAHLLSNEQSTERTPSMIETHAKVLNLDQEKDKWESIGFQNGNRPYTDCRAVGIQGPILLIEFFEKIEKMFIEAQNIFL